MSSKDSSNSSNSSLSEIEVILEDNEKLSSSSEDSFSFLENSQMENSDTNTDNKTNKKEEMLQNEEKNLQCNLTNKTYLSDLRNWPIFNLLKPDFMPQVHTVMAYCWENRAIIVTEDKIVYTFGYEDNDSETNNTFFCPRKVEELCGKNIMTFAHSSFCALVLTEEGELYSSSFKTRESDKPVAFTPTRVAAFINTRIVSIACGYNHYLALTNHGKVYAWGGNDRGQIGDKTTTFRSNSNPWEVKYTLENKNVVQIACGLQFNIVLTDDGQLYGWGYNGSNQIAVTKDQSNRGCNGYNDDYNYDYNYQTCPHAILITTISDKIVKVVCGYNHTLVLTDKGEVYVWGSNNFRQVGVNKDQVVPKPAMVNVPSTVVDIAAYANTSVAVGSDKIIYVWGDCFGHNINTPFPTQFSKIHDVFAYNSSKVMHKPITVSTDDYEYIKEVSNIMESLKAAFDDVSTSDFTVQVEGKPIHVHKAMLQIRSQYFRDKFQRDCTDEDNHSTPDSAAVYITSDEYSYIVYKAFLKYLYTGTVDVPSENALELIKLADRYHGTGNLKRECSQILKRAITASNVIFFYKEAIKYNAKELEEFCFRLAVRDMKGVVLSEDFTKLDKNTMISFIRKAAEKGVLFFKDQFSN